MNAKNPLSLTRYIPPPPDKHNKLQPWRVDALSRADDHHCVALARMGFTYRCIAEQTGLTPGAISYCLRKYGVSPKTYRAGRNDAARIVVQAVAVRIAAMINQECRLINETHEHKEAHNSHSLPNGKPAGKIHDI